MPAVPVRVARRRNERNPHLGVAASAQAGNRQPERRRHDAAHDVAALVERDGLADDVAPAAKAPPEDARDDGAVVVGEPLAEERRPELPRQGRRHRRAGDELRLAGRCQLVSAGTEPAEHVEARCLLLVVLQLGNRHRHERARRCRARAVQRHEALAARVGQRPEHHAADDGEDRRGRADADGKRHHCEQCDAGRRFPGGPGLGEGRQHVAVTLTLQQLFYPTASPSTEFDLIEPRPSGERD